MNGFRLASVVLDLATSLTPGVGWARDIYEAVTGRTLLTSEDLTTAEGTFAILGAVTGGIVGEGPKILRALELAADLGISGEVAVHIVQAADKIDNNIDWSYHALYEELPDNDMTEAGLNKFNVEAALDLGSRFWDRDIESIVVFEETFTK